MIHPSNTYDEQELLFFWAIGDLHYRALPSWQEVHTQRFAPMFKDLHALWKAEGTPAFCVSPGDIIETCTLENYATAKADLATHLGSVPFYPGIGNHEFYGEQGEGSAQVVEAFSTAWGMPLRYIWTSGEVTCIMLDYPNPLTSDPLNISISQETLEFLDMALTHHAENPAIIFLHCPLRDTVLDRDPVEYRDYNSQQSFFSPENSQAVRDILARHSNACLYFSGHTHSGWEAPKLVCTEQLGRHPAYPTHPVTFVNLMSPWYTGTGTGPGVSEDGSIVEYIPDDPDVVTTFAVRVYQHKAVIRVREHRTRQWLKEWVVPLINVLNF